MRGAVGLPAVKITNAGLPRIFTRLAVVLIAARSKALGRHGINTRSAASTAALAALSAWGGGVDHDERRALGRCLLDLGGEARGALSITTGGASCRHAAHWLAVACGSRSITSAVCPESSAAAASVGRAWFSPRRPSG
jgi:hypothetical protein